MNSHSAFHNMVPSHQMHITGSWPSQYTGYVVPPPNRFVYVKQNFVQGLPQQESLNPKVHVNPNFNKKVFVNPNFQRNVGQSTVSTKIHVNPHSQNIQIDKNMLGVENSDYTKKIHVNPNILRSIPIPVEDKKQINSSNKIVYSSRTKLIRNSEKSPGTSSIQKTRRKSVCSKYKIVKSHLLKHMSSPDKKTRTKLISPGKYRLLKLKFTVKRNNQYKLDNRLSIKTAVSQKICDQNKRKSKVCLKKFKTPSLLKIDNILYRKSLHSLRRTSDIKKVRCHISALKTESKTICKSRYKLLRKRSSIKKCLPNTTLLKRSNSKTKLRIVKVKKPTVSPGKLRKCNIPCFIYRKFGRCREYEKGKCFKKHDPDQIALCTKFLQGACINEKCLLSHNVSPEKMPTCKYYLEATCSKDHCPYLHVRISPKADICKDFLEGFCKKAKECDKRHQFLCPDYEKYGKCLKQRCPYPHGRMVRKYSVFHSDKFAKKSSEPKMKNSNDAEDPVICDDDDKIVVKTRYYAGSKSMSESSKVPTVERIEENECNQKFNLLTRPKLGTLPSFIAFQDS